MILDCGNQKILEVDRQYNVTLSIDLPDGGKNSHTRYMQARKTPQGTYLISYREKAKILELNKSGEIIWKYQLEKTDRPFTAIRLKNGNTLVPCITSNRMIEISPDGEIVWELNNKDDLGFQIWYPVGAQVLKNGNMVGTFAPDHADGIKLAAAQTQPVSDENAGERWTLYTFFSPT